MYPAWAWNWTESSCGISRLTNSSLLENICTETPFSGEQIMTKVTQIIVWLFVGPAAMVACFASEQGGIACAADIKTRKAMSLDGTWSFALDSKRVGEKENWPGADKALTDMIQVPGCWQAQGFGTPQKILRHHYEGPAWYKKTIAIPADRNDRALWLKIGGAARFTKAYVNGKLVGSHDGWLAPFKFDITDAVRWGEENVIAIRVDNSTQGPVGCFNYVGNWGGIHRPVALEVTSTTWIEDIFVIPDVDRNQARLQIAVNARNKLAAPHVRLKVQIRPAANETKGDVFRAEKDIDAGDLPREVTTEMTVAMSNVKLWFPESPHLYTAEVTLLADGDVLDVQRVRFGMRKIDWLSAGLKVNNRPYFLRGYGDDNTEVMTGLPPASKEFFLKRLALTKSFGFNDVRFHSHAPFEECFEAADEAGMFIQAELPAGGAEMVLSYKEHLRKELVQVLKAYRNHPSFFSLALGNEFYVERIKDVPGRQRAHDSICELYELAKSLDPTRPILANDGDYTLRPTDIHSGWQSPMIREAWVSGRKLWSSPIVRPYTCHEYGRYRTSLPDIADKDKLTGLVAPSAGYTVLDRWVREHSLTSEYPVILKNSQRLLEVFRKICLERIRLCPDVDGFHYWLMTDFAGGVEGDVWPYGILDQFWQIKQATPESIRRVNSPTVLLLDDENNDRSCSRCIWADEGKSFSIMVSHFGSQPLREGCLSWRLVQGDKVLADGRQTGIAADIGDVKEIAKVFLPNLPLDKGGLMAFIIELQEPNGKYVNSWPVWAFPWMNRRRPTARIARQPSLAGALAMYNFIEPFDAARRPDVLIAMEFDDAVRQYVSNGGNVLLFPRRNSLVGQTTFSLFMLGTASGSGPGTVIEPGGVMDGFPHNGFCDEQFLDLMQTGTGVEMDSLPKDLHPEVWGISSTRDSALAFVLSRLAILFSARFEKGNILVCTFDVPSGLIATRPEAHYLFHLLLDYVASDRLQPRTVLTKKAFLRD
jgi:beta-galactosidase